MSIARTILICDDEPHIRHVVAAKLRSAGFSVHEARNGSEARTLLGISPTGQVGPGTVVPDLIITDLQMPQVSGLELAQSIRQARMQVPVIMLTARGYILTPEQLESSGIVELIAKPFGVRALLERVEAHLGGEGKAQPPQSAQAA
jgi:two-component system alkaline phosphatase synthesis response regulator PhoP